MGLFGSKEDPEDLMYNAMSFIERNQPKAAITLFNKIIKQDPKNIAALYNKGLALNRIKKYQDAVTCFNLLLEINPKDSQAYNNKGIAMAEMGDTQTANECYDKAISSDPKNSSAYFNKSSFT